MKKRFRRSVSGNSSEMSSISSASGASSFTNYSVGPTSQSTMNDLKTYLCPKCNRSYDISLRSNVYVGRVPLILHCKHTMCEECVRVSFSKREVVCAECQQPSQLDDYKCKLQEIFPVNFYLLGAIYYSKPNMSEISKINLKPAGVSYKNRAKANLGSSISLLEAVDVSSMTQNALQESCCQVACNKVATLRCADCDEVYCETCCQTLHKAARGLQAHKVTAISASAIPELTDKCSVHKDSSLEFQCNTCDKVLCCYCVLQAHAGHSYCQLTYVDDSDRVNFQVLIENAEEKLKKLIVAQKKVKWQLDQIQSNTQVSTTEAAVGRYFTNLHARLQLIEKKLRRDANRAKNSNLYTLNDLNTQLLSDIRTLNALVTTAKNVNTPQSNTKLNVKLVIERLENSLGLPCYLVGEQQDGEKTGFVCGDVFNDLEEYFTISVDHNSDGFRLVGETEVPADYDTSVPNEIVSLSVTDIVTPYGDGLSSPASLFFKSQANLTPSELLTDALKPKPGDMDSNIVSNWVENVIDTRTTVNNIPSLRNDDRENVIITHIDTPECFYVQLIRFTSQLRNLSKEINQYIRHFAPVVKVPEHNKLYVVKYETKNAPAEWYRGRIIDIILNKNGDTVYSVLFIDYGNTQIVSLHKLREINSELAKPKPFALQCKLYNVYPVRHDWDRKAMLLMAQIITGTNVVMVVMNNSEGILEVDLVAITGGDVASIRDALIFVGHGVPCLTSDTPVVNLKMKNVKTPPKLHTRTDNFKRRQQVEVILSHIVDPHNIYIQFADFVHHINHLSEVMGHYYNSKPNKGQALGQVKGDNIYVPRKDMIVAVRHNEGANIWHRATVTDVVDGQGMVNVFLVDSGKSVTVSYTHIRRLPERFRNLDCQAILVKMADVQPKNKIWAATATAFLSKYVVNKSKLYMLIVEPQPPATVGLFERYASMEICINTMLVREGFAVSTGEITKKLEWTTDEIASPKEKSTYVSDLMNTIQCAKKTNIEANSDSDEEMGKQPIIRKPVNVLLTKSPDLIYVNLIDEASQKMQRDLHFALQEFYNKHHGESKEWQVNDPCVVFNKSKKAYFRAIILEKVDNLNYKVMLRDIAEEVVASRGNIRILQSQFKQFREGAIRCHLAGITPAGDKNKWSGLAIEFLQDIFEKNFNIFMTKSGSIDIVRKSLPVIMWYSEFKPGEALEPSRTVLHNLNKLLIKNGLAFKERNAAESGATSSPNTKGDASADTVKEGVISQQKLTTKAEIKDADKHSEENPAAVLPSSCAANTSISLHQKATRKLFPTAISRDTKPTTVKVLKRKESDPEFEDCKAQEFKPSVAIKEIKSECVFEDKITSEDKCDSSALSVHDSKNASVEENKTPGVVTNISEKQSASGNSPFNKKSGGRYSPPLNYNSMEAWKCLSISDNNIPQNFSADSFVTDIKTEDPLAEITDWNELIEHNESLQAAEDTERISDATNWLPPDPFRKNKFFAYATFVDDNACIYLHDAELEPVLKCMEEEMKVYFDQTPSEPIGSIWVPGQLCTVKYFVNESWYRGKVVNVTDEFIKVLMIDYGNEEECKHEDLRFKVMYMDVPAFANKVLLYKVFPKTGSKWFTSDLDELHKKVVENKIFVTLKGAVRPGKAIPAVISLNGTDINQFMVENSANLVSFKQRTNEDVDTDSDVIIEDDTMTELESDISDSQACENTFIQNPLSEELVGQKVNMSVTSIIDYNHFIFEILTDQDVEKTKTLFESISEDIRNSAHTQPVLLNLEVGQACVARFSEDGEWYRGQVSSLGDSVSSAVEIWFVDFGNSESVPRDNVRAIRSEWLRLPVLQYRGEIGGIEVADPACLDIVTEYMAELCNTVKIAEILSVNPLAVRLYGDDNRLAYQDLFDQRLLIHN